MMPPPFASRCDWRSAAGSSNAECDIYGQINKDRDAARESIPRICIETPDLGVNANTAVRTHRKEAYRNLMCLSRKAEDGEL